MLGTWTGFDCRKLVRLERIELALGMRMKLALGMNGQLELQMVYFLKGGSIPVLRSDSPLFRVFVLNLAG